MASITAILNPLGPSGQGEMNPHLSAALASATNDWQLDLLDAARFPAQGLDRRAL